MRKIELFIIICLLITLSSCFSTIAVRVDSFDMDKMRKTQEYLNAYKYNELNNYNIMVQTHYFEKLKESLISKIQGSLNNDPRFDKTQLNETITNVKPKINMIVDDWKQKTIAVRDALEAYLTLHNDEKGKTEYEAVYEEYLLSRNKLKDFEVELARELGEKISDHTRNFLDLIAEKSIEETDTTFGISIVNDYWAPFIVKAPEDYWRKYKASFYKDSTDLTKAKAKARMNVTKITTFVGNSDVAVKMDGPGNFIIKGVRLDADAAFRTSFKVLSQGIKYLTYAAGIPAVPASGSSATPAAKIPEIANLNQNKAQSEALNNSYEIFTDTFLKILDSQKDDLLSGNPDKRKAAINTIKEAYDFYKSQLQTQ